MHAGLVALRQEIARRLSGEQKKAEVVCEGETAGWLGVSGSQLQQDSEKSDEADDLVDLFFPTLVWLRH